MTMTYYKRIYDDGTTIQYKTIRRRTGRVTTYNDNVLTQKTNKQKHKINAKLNYPKIL